MKIHKKLEIKEDKNTFKISNYLPIWLIVFIQGIKSIIKWITVIYKDKNWDDWYVFELLKFKLIQQRHCLINGNKHEGLDIVNRDITLCLNLIERIQGCYYETEYQDYQITKIISEINENSKYCKLEIKKVSEDLPSFFKKYPNSFRKVLKKGNIYYTEWDKYTQALALSNHNQFRCQTLLFKILNERINNWWD